MIKLINEIFMKRGYIMKKLLSLFLVFTLAVSVLIIPANAASEGSSDKTVNLTIGKTYTDTVTEYQYFYQTLSGTHTYNFTISSSCNAKIAVKTDKNVEWSIGKPASSGFYSYTSNIPKADIYYFKKGESYTIKVSGAGKYTLKVSKAAADKLKIKSKSGKTTSSAKTVPFTFSGTYDYAKEHLSVKSSNKKVATASYSLTGAKSGKITVTPKYYGKAVVSLKMKGSNTVKYTLYATDGHWYVAKGSKAKVPKPSGVSKLKWKSSKKKVATINKKSGKIKAKKGGRVTFSAKKGKVTYKLKTVVTDYIKLGKKTYKKLKETVNNPEKLKIYNVYKGYSKKINGVSKVPVLVIDYGSTNDNGAMVRNKIMAYYNDVYEPQYTNGWDIDNIIGRKTIKAKKIKK